MAGATDYSAQSFLNWLTGKTAMPATAARYLGLFTAAGIDAGTGFTEVSGGSYARVQVPTANWNSASLSAPSSVATNAIASFATSTADWTGGGATPIVAWGLFDALTGGNLLEWDYLGNFAWAPFSCSLASPGVITLPAHGFANGDQVVVTNEFGGTLPSTAGSWSGLKTVAGVTTDTFTAGVNTTSTGNGMLRKVATQAVPNNTTFSIGAGNLIITQG